MLGVLGSTGLSGPVLFYFLLSHQCNAKVVRVVCVVAELAYR